MKLRVFEDADVEEVAKPKRLAKPARPLLEQIMREVRLEKGNLSLS